MDIESSRFLGNYEVSLDSKNRLSIPAKWRGLLGDEVVISKEGEDCFVIRNKESWEKMCRELLDNSAFSSGAQILKRRLFGSSIPIKLDVYKRFVIPNRVKEIAVDGEGLILLGAGDSIELWRRRDYEAWSEREENSYQNASMKMLSEKKN